MTALDDPRAPGAGPDASGTGPGPDVQPPSERELRLAFDAPTALTVGVEEELLLADPDTLDLVDRGPEIVAELRAPTAVKLELPRAQVEIVTPASRSAREARAALADGRAELARAAAGLARPIAAGGHPFGAVSGPLNVGERYEAIAAEYGPVARRQLVSALQVHVAIGDAAAALDVHNALRSYLPELAALAANAPFRAGRDSGLASIRPKVCELMPRQGVPPAIPSWAAFADLLSWGARSATLADPGAWWWELRPHPAHGTLELRVPDAQTTVADAEAVVAVAHALVAHLLERRANGEELAVDQTWRIEENRWSACRWGVEGVLADLRTGERRTTRARLHALLDDLEPVAAGLDGARGLERARALVEHNGALRQRAVAAATADPGGAPGAHAATAWLADAFLADD